MRKGMIVLFFVGVLLLLVYASVCSEEIQQGNERKDLSTESQKKNVHPGGSLVAECHKVCVEWYRATGAYHAPLNCRYLLTGSNDKESPYENKGKK